MSLQKAVSAMIAVFRSRPERFLPVYLLTPAVPIIARVTWLLGIAASYLYLLRTDRIQTLGTELAAVDLGLPPENEEALVEWMEDLLAVLEVLFPPTVVGILLLSTLAFVVGFALLYAAIGAAQLSACYARLRSERGLTAAIAGARRYWVTILGLLVFEFLIWVLLTAAALGTVAVAFAVSPVLGALTTLLAFLLWFAIGAFVRAVFAFAPVSVIVQERSVLASLRGSLRFIRRHPVDAASYYAVAVAVFVLMGGFAGLLSPIGGAPLIAIVGFLLVTPALDLLKTALFGDRVRSIDPPAVPERGVGQQAVAGVRRGWNEMLAFVRDTPGLHAVALFVGVASFVAGWAMAAPFEGILHTSIVARLEGHVPPIAALEFATNNWTVAVSTAYSGVFLGIPTISSLAFNGVVFGLYARLEVDRLELLAFVLPHGIVEIPAIVFAGALGLFLGVVAWRTLRGRATREDLADALERAFWVLIGIAVLLVVAAIVEGFVSPYYYRPFV